MADSSESPAASPDVITVAAPLLFGPVFNWALYGVLCVQIYVYSYNFPNDRRPVKILAYFVFVLETIQTALTGADIYYWFVDGFGNVERLAHSRFAPIDDAMTIGVMSIVVQGYFCYRIWVMNKRSSWICWIIAVSAVTQSAAATWLGVKSLMVGKYVVSKTGLYLWSIPGALADILIVVAMTQLLRRASGNFTSFVLIRIVRITVETNALTAASAITTLVLYAAFPNKLYYVYITEIIGKLYSNTLLVSLNNRIYLREHQLSEHGDSACLVVSDRVRVPVLSSLSFPSRDPQTSPSKGVIFPLYPISQPRNLDHNNDEVTSTDLLPPLPRISRTLPEDLEWAVVTSSHFHGQKDQTGRS